jgi:carboxypeptidase Taq
MSVTIEKLRERLAQIYDLQAVEELLGWDQQTQMPRGGAAGRAEATATVARIAHERFTSAETGELLAAAAAELQNGDPNSDDAVIVKKAKADYRRAVTVPDDLAAELARAASAGEDAWVAARAANDFQAFAPYLQHNIELAREYVDCIKATGDYDSAYDALLDGYDRGMRTATVQALFSELKDALVPLIAELRDRALPGADLVATRFAVPDQRRLVAQVLERMGFDKANWRIDDTIHPFETSFGMGDVRITVRYAEDYFPTALFGAMHESGHGLYCAGVAPELARTPLADLDSLVLHESQSRLWENMVGRSRAFDEWLAPRAAALGGGALAGLDPGALFRAVNKVSPSLIRIEADETTYALHIVLRFELEQELIEGRLAVADLPQAWAERMRSYLGLEVPSDADGVMQDVHWSSGLIGYFPTYALGTLVSGQLWQRLRAELPDLDAQLARGDLSGAREWLGENVYRLGSRYTSQELVDRVCGGPIAVTPFVDYLKAKLTDVYGVAL